MSAKIEVPNPEKITLSNLIFDVDNPNEMSEEQEKSLGNSMKEFGVSLPVGWLLENDGYRTRGNMLDVASRIELLIPSRLFNPDMVRISPF